MTVAAEWKQTLSASSKRCRTDRTEIVQQLSESKKKVAKQMKRLGLDGNWQAQRDADTKLRDFYYSRWIASSYPVVDLSFFAEARIELLVRRTVGGVEIVGAKDREPSEPTEKAISVSRYAIQREGRSNILGALPSPGCQLGAFSFNQFQLNRERFRSYSGFVCCNRPEGYPNYLRTRLRDVAALGLEAHAAAVRAGVAVGAAELSRTILWCPRVEDMFVNEQIPVRDDPAILVMSGDRAHLIGFWDSPDENPIEGVLREFSEGSFESIDD